MKYLTLCTLSSMHSKTFMGELIAVFNMFLLVTKFLICVFAAFNGISQVGNPELFAVRFSDERIHDRLCLSRDDVTGSSPAWIPDTQNYRRWQTRKSKIKLYFYNSPKLKCWAFTQKPLGFQIVSVTQKSSKITDAIKKKFHSMVHHHENVFKSAQHHRLAPCVLSPDVLDKILNHALIVAQKCNLIPFVNNALDLFQTEVSHLYNPVTKEFTLILHTPMVSNANFLDLFEHSKPFQAIFSSDFHS
jgi:hypothetical protein